MRSTLVSLRKRSAWRELLHALPTAHRESLWLKRDKVEMNEAVLRRPYYSLRPPSEGKGYRESLVSPGAIGPGLIASTPHSLGAPLPRYPDSWDTVAPHPSVKE